MTVLLLFWTLATQLCIHVTYTRKILTKGPNVLHHEKQVVQSLHVVTLLIQQGFNLFSV